MSTQDDDAQGAVGCVPGCFGCAIPLLTVVAAAAALAARAVARRPAGARGGR